MDGFHKLDIQRLTVESTVRGFHMSRSFWKPDEKKTYRCDKESKNSSIAIFNDDDKIVGHVPKEYSGGVLAFLSKKDSRLECKITGPSFKNKKTYITELPCKYIFEGSKDGIHNIRKLFETDNMSLEEKDLDMIRSHIGVKGCMQVQRVFLHGPPGAGKSSLLRVILGQNPVELSEENSTGILQPPERLVSTKKIIKNSEDILQKVDEYDVLSMMANELKRVNNTNDSILGSTISGQLVQSFSPACASSQINSKEASRQLINEIGELLLNTKSEKLNASVFSVLWFHLIDSGGQPQFTQLLPLIYPSNKNIYFFVIRLDNCLNQKPDSMYIKNGVQTKLSEVLSCTWFEMVENLCKTAKLSNSKVKIIGTHLDCIQGNEALVQKENELNKLKDLYEDVLILNANGSVIYALNAMEKDAMKRTQYQKDLKHIIVDKEVLCVDRQVPLSWLVLQLLIKRESRCGVIAYSDVQKFAEQLKISDLEHALQLFSELALIFFFPEVLSEVVIDDLGVLTCSISRIIFSTIVPSTSQPQSEEQIAFRRTGICPKLLLSSICKDFLPIKDPNIFTIDHFLDILQHLKVLHALPGQKFFLPCILPQKPTSALENSADPLLLFLQEYAPLPHAFFSATIVSLLSVDKICLCRGCKAQQYRNDISLQYRDSNTVQVIRLIDKIHWLEIYWQSTSANRAYFHCFLRIINAQVNTVFKLLKQEPTYQLGIKCPKKCGYDEVHPCCYLASDSNKISFQCMLEERIVWSEDKSDKTSWFSSDEDLSDDNETVDLIDDKEMHQEEHGPERKRSSPSQNSKTDGTRKKRASTKHISLENFISSHTSIKKLATSLRNRDLISDTVHRDIVNGDGILLSTLVSVLESEINSRVLPNHKDDFVKILGELQDPLLERLINELKK